MQPSNRTSREWAKSALFASLLTTIAISSGGTIVAQTTRKPATAKSLPGKSATEAEPRFKAIWEPVNVKEDLQLVSVHFATADEGWVAGGRSGSGGGVIVHTKDGGANWDVQLGDPQSSDRPYRDLRFVNARVGFAAQSTSSGDHQLLRTTDGQTWAPVGKLAQHRSDYRFISAEAGLLAGGGGIQRTQDAGRTWKQVYVCRIKAEINAGAENDLCHIYNDLNNRIRDGLIAKSAAVSEIKRLLGEIRPMYYRQGGKEYQRSEWVFPLAGYDSRATSSKKRI